jgi:phosphate transport system protein
MRTTFDRELQTLQDRVLILGSEVEENLGKVVDAAVHRNPHLAQQMISADRWINERRIQIGLDALVLIALQQPMARDLRLIAAVLEIVGELERIHDYVKGIGKISLGLGPGPLLASLAVYLPEMAAVARDMLHRALDAFARGDADLARAIPSDDDHVDALFNQLYGDIIQFVVADPEAIDRANQMEWVLHNLERSADRVTNICEWVVYMVTGVYAEMDSEYEAPPVHLEIID